MMLKDKLEKLVIDGFVRKTKHPTHDLYIYNYTKKTQFEQHWNRYTEMARGIVLNADGKIIARPFKKFFNFGELPANKIPTGKSFEVYTKLDGSLGLIFLYKNEIIISTRGSFVSDQAIYAKKIFNEKYFNIKLEYDKTYLVEIIYPENKIIVNYEDTKDLFLLAIIDNKTGKDLPLDYTLGFPVVTKHDGISDYKELCKLNEKNKEGFVVKFENDFRIKIKMQEYVRLHKILTGLTNKIIWEQLKLGKNILDLIESIPDEFYSWIKSIQSEIIDNYSKIESLSWENLSELQRTIKAGPAQQINRKLQAEFIQSKPYSNVLFAMLDGKDYSKIIWSLVKPTVLKTPGNF